MSHLDKLIPAKTALVLIDLQAGILARDTQPRTSAEVLATGVELADAFRAAGGLVVLVHVSFAPDRGDALKQSIDMAVPAGSPPAGWDVIAPELKPEAAGTIVVKKRNWGAFYGTDLDLQLRRRGIDSIVLGGIATQIGVESTARAAYEHGYQLFLVEDAMATMEAADHTHTVTKIFPRLGHVISTADVLGRLNQS